MWTLGETLTRLADRLGETSEVFWSEANRIAYINDAQSFISNITKGVEQTVIGSVSYTSNPFVALPSNAIGIHSKGGHIIGGDALNVVPISDANQSMPTWRVLRSNSPLWFVVDLEGKKAYLTPIPKVLTSVSLSVAVLPTSFATDGSDNAESVFGGSQPMEKYQPALLQLASTYALLKERYDQEAEKYYQFFMQEMQALGVNPSAIPPFEGVKQNVAVDS